MYAGQGSTKTEKRGDVFSNIGRHRMRIGTFAREAEQVREALKYKPDFIDLRMDLNHSIDFSDTKKLLEEHDTPCTLHLPSSPEWSPMDLPRSVIPFIDIGASIGAELVTMHSALSPLFYSDEAIDHFLQAVPLACKAAKEDGVTLAIETLGLYYTELTLLFDRCPDVQIALDVGHGQIFAMKNRAIPIIESYMDRVAMVNIHDNNGSKMVEEVLKLRKEGVVSREEMRAMAREYDTHLPLGKGEVNFEPILHRLKEKAYDGRFLLMAKDPARFPEERDMLRELWERS